MKIGDKVHYKPTDDFKKRGYREWDGKIVANASYLGDGKRKLWGIAMPHWGKSGYVVVEQNQLSVSQEK